MPYILARNPLPTSDTRTVEAWGATSTDAVINIDELGPVVAEELRAWASGTYHISVFERRMGHVRQRITALRDFWADELWCTISRREILDTQGFTSRESYDLRVRSVRARSRAFATFSDRTD